MRRDNKRKAFMVTMATLMCSVVLLTGTYAWSSINQTALNEVMGEMKNPGGRLHDDFDGNKGDKNIYVENFTSQMDGTPIIVRIRLREYMELGSNAGNKADRSGVTVLKTDPAANPQLNDPKTWEIYKHGGNHYGYWTWDMGGTDDYYYMPTFNKDKDSKDSDINGTFANSFNDYHKYADNEFKDDYETLENGVLSEDQARHYAARVADAEVISMETWQSGTGKDGALGAYWVYDEDGWAYWAEPLNPSETTGRLLNEISHSTIQEKWYYGIYVECQMVDAEGIGNSTSAEGFYSVAADGAPSTAAEALLATLVNRINTDAGTTAIGMDALLQEEQLTQQEEIQKIYEAMLEQEAAEEAAKKDEETEVSEDTNETDQDVTDETQKGEETKDPDENVKPEGTPDQADTQKPDEDQGTDSDNKDQSTTEVPSDQDTEKKETTESEVPSQADRPLADQSVSLTGALLGLFRHGVQ